MAKAVKQAEKARKARPAPAQPAEDVQQAPLDARSILSQPVGGSSRLLLESAPVTAARSVPRSEPLADEDSDTSGMPKPVLLEPKLPNVPNGKRHKTEREATVSPVVMAFIAWLQQSLANRSIKYNETGATVHFVEHGMALVSPLIFKLYAATQVPESEIEEHALHVQRELVKARWHVVGPGNVNILNYRVLGRGGKQAGKLSAVVLTDPGRFVLPVPPINPALSLDTK